MTHTNIQQDITHVQNALESLSFEDTSTLENAPKELQALLDRVSDQYKIKLVNEGRHLQEILNEVKVELEKEASYLQQSSYRP